MTLTSTWRTRIFGTAASTVALVLATEIAQEKFFWPYMCAGALIALLFIFLQPLPLSTLLLGGLLVGYVVGNRGFAQLSLTGQFPLLPAEFTLLVAGAILLVSNAFARESPVRRDALNLVILLWMVTSSIRLFFDLRTYGFAAIRDYATVYYATFFFLAQQAGKTGVERTFLRRCLMGGCAALLLIYPLSVQFPGFFLQVLTVRGMPLIFLKADLAGTFLAVGAVLFYLHFEQRRSLWALGLSLAFSATVIATNNRASMLGLFVAIFILAVAGRWRFALFQGGAAIGATLVILLVVQLRNESWKQTPLYGMYERVISLVDPQGQREYLGADTFYKGDNNLYRAVWWKTCIHETLRSNPWMGLGWGYDLAEPFVRVYYPEGGDDFTTRSPHSVLVTVFARTGVTGLIPFLAILAVMARRAWRAAHDLSLGTAGIWCGAWVILTSACLGVVLEGPMGAVVFWIMLGLANSAWLAERAGPSADEAEPVEVESTAASLRSAAGGISIEVK